VPIGYYLSKVGSRLFSQPAHESQMASLGPKTDALASSELPRVMAQDDETRDDEVRGDDRGMPTQSEISSKRPETSHPLRSEGQTVAMLQPSPIGEQAPLSSKPIRVLGPDEIKLLMKQGEHLIAAGDVVAARTVLQRAAEAGNASAAVALGATYDPN